MSSSFPGGSDCNAGDLGSIPGLGRSPGEGNGNPFQYSCLENSMDAWWATVHGIAKSRTRLRNFTGSLGNAVSQMLISLSNIYHKKIYFRLLFLLPLTKYALCLWQTKDASPMNGPLQKDVLLGLLGSHLEGILQLSASLEPALAGDRYLGQDHALPAMATPPN